MSYMSEYYTVLRTVIHQFVYPEGNIEKIIDRLIGEALEGNVFVFGAAFHRTRVELRKDITDVLDLLKNDVSGSYDDMLEKKRKAGKK